MKLGTDEHTRLELSSHPTVLVEPPTLTMDPIDVPYLYEAYAKESEIAENISESILYRLYNLFVTSEAREIRVHGYVNLQSLELESFRQTSDSTLINGIIDLIELKDKHNPETDFSMIHDIEQYLPTFNIPIMETYTEDRDQQQGIIVPDSETSDKFTLTTFLDQLTQLLPYYSDSMELIIGDIKTRSVQSIPRQQSVIESAKFQVFYYHQFLTILATSGNSYRSLVDSWQLRNVDLDVPINYKTMFMLLKKYGPLLFDDMIKLSKGVSLGMDQFDEFIINNPTTKSTVVYDPSECFAEHKSSHPLLRPWVNPPTLRYLLARCSQMYQVLGPFISPKCKVEYRNGHTHKVIATNEYEFDSNEFKAQIHKASSFWNGSQNPKINQDISKCKYCEFKAHCPVPHHQVHNDTGDGIQPPPKKLGDLVYHEFLHVQM
ncbi:Mitochondrial 5'-3' exonuclease and sliding exonuclease [Scheffersomyces spartinae]|uniref:Exonuclease V, mitochondrial n=1 Tax=Scheffersomyces spartinae TaxID=45513 RepID=A0A9P7V7J9_9ASCO|nr:Mitochondrial 5'-3' exonuclease and sliding exonuclease [Scheffersomyces spartinae]KAG7192724.1 Mitochondrial 5'-3' exonuclease and sliding exonuclease [Scheffersomyces spartinae]